MFKAFFSVSSLIPWICSHLRLFFSILSDSLNPFVPCVSKLSSLRTFSRWVYLYGVASKHLSQILLVSAVKGGACVRPPFLRHLSWGDSNSLPGAGESQLLSVVRGGTLTLGCGGKPSLLFSL